MNHDLFATTQEEKFNLPDAEISVFRGFYSQLEANECFRQVQAEVNWQQDTIRFGDRITKLPRLTAFVGDRGTSYQYSGIASKAILWPPSVLTIRDRIKDRTGFLFNCALLNQYRDGRDHVSWHADDERELGSEPMIGSLSLGESRLFQLKHKAKAKLRYEIQLNHGDYLIMKGTTQQHWDHRVPAQSQFTGPRINLTFRLITK